MKIWTFLKTKWLEYDTLQLPVQMEFVEIADIG